MQRWTPPVALRRKTPRWRFAAREDGAFQEQLEGMYRTTGAGDEPHPPALLCMVLLLQGYVGASDAEAVELSLVDLRWQMVLDCLRAATPPFSQGALVAFRERMIAHDMDRVLLDRTVALVASPAAPASRPAARVKGTCPRRHRPTRGGVTVEVARRSLQMEQLKRRSGPGQRHVQLGRIVAMQARSVRRPPRPPYSRCSSASSPSFETRAQSNPACEPASARSPRRRG